MSVILDALRRARGLAPVRPSAPRPSPGIPAGLRVGGPPKRKPKGSGTRWGMLAVVVVLAGIVWAGVQFGLPLLQRNAAPIGGTVTTVPRATQPVPPAAAQPPAPERAAPAPADTLTTVTEPPATPPAPAPARPAGTGSGRRGGPSGSPARRPLPAPPAPALTIPAVTAAAPTPTVNHFDLAVRYHSLGNFEQALTHYTAVLQAEEFNVEARNNLGLLYHERGLAKEAIEQFRRAILINPEYLRARSNLAVVLMSAGRLAEARAELRAALAIDPRNVDLLVNMALVEKADRLPDQAREILIRALGHQPSHAAAHYNLAVLYDEAGELGRAYDHYSEFLKNAGPEHGARLSDVRRRVDLIAPKLASPEQNR